MQHGLPSILDGGLCTHKSQGDCGPGCADGSFRNSSATFARWQYPLATSIAACLLMQSPPQLSACIAASSASASVSMFSARHPSLICWSVCKYSSFAIVLAPFLHNERVDCHFQSDEIPVTTFCLIHICGYCPADVCEPSDCFVCCHAYLLTMHSPYTGICRSPGTCSRLVVLSCFPS